MFAAIMSLPCFVKKYSIKFHSEEGQTGQSNINMIYTFMLIYDK